MITQNDLDDCCEALEQFGDDELERFAAEFARYKVKRVQEDCFAIYKDGLYDCEFSTHAGASRYIEEACKA